MSLRSQAKAIFATTMQHLGVAEAVERLVHCQGETLHLGQFSYALGEFQRVILIGVGKAAVAMTNALLSSVEPGLRRGQSFVGVVVGTATLSGLDDRFRYFRGSHPIPDQTSRDAAELVLELLRSAGERCLVLFAISGGASAMLEKPLDDSFSVEEVAFFNRCLIHSGLPIAMMNTFRSHFSQVKGGRLAVAAGRATQCTLLISDVPESTLHVVGSGPSLPDLSTVKQCREILDVYRNALNFPDKLRAYFEDPALQETAKPNHAAFRKSAWISLLTSEDLLRVAEEAAEKMGFHVVVDNTCDEWEYKDAAAYLVERFRGLQGEYRNVCLLSAGEVSVRIPREHGIGGRNLQFALECSRLLAEQHLRCAVLSGGSDGIDGNSPAAGAVCDETTVERAAEKGWNVVAGLERFDAYNIFHALDDAIVTGPTGNNVRDLRILLGAAD